jgi:hypothetical protein
LFGCQSDHKLLEQAVKCRATYIVRPFVLSFNKDEPLACRISEKLSWSIYLELLFSCISVLIKNKNHLACFSVVFLFTTEVGIFYDTGIPDPSLLNRKLPLVNSLSLNQSETVFKIKFWSNTF